MKRKAGFVALGLLVLAGAAAWGLRGSRERLAEAQRAEDRLPPPAPAASEMEKAAYRKKLEAILAGQDPLASRSEGAPNAELNRRLDARREAARARFAEIQRDAAERARRFREERAKDPNRKPAQPFFEAPDLGPAVVEGK